MPVGVSQNPVRAIKAQVELTRPIEDSNLGIRHPSHLGNDLVPGTPFSRHRLTKRSTGIMIVTRPWRGPGILDSSAGCPREHSEQG